MSCKPNVIVVITDDQGYGDLGCTGNPYIKTPNIDKFYDESVRLSDFHVSPLCTPTRGAIMSGNRPLRNGAWATCWGRSILSSDEVTIADLFKEDGYRTALFGKWHLGDNYPYRPMDRGFEHVVAHKGGGVGQTPDFWGNNYFDDTYFHNGEPVKHEGYCTDVWFEEADKFIRENVEKPFLAFITTNAPHSPYLVADKYSLQYRNNPEIVHPEFYGMITNIDENFGKLRKTLSELDIEDSTILIFMTDNGSSGCGLLDDKEFVTTGYNAGMRGVKASYYDGGHRVPFFMRYPKGNLTGGIDVEDMAFHIDMLPTLCAMCGIDTRHLKKDGIDIGEIIKGNKDADPTRTEFIQIRQSAEPPLKWSNAVINKEWRLIFGEELYHIPTDPGQRNDVADKYPEIVAEMRQKHEDWWGEIEGELSEISHMSLGSKQENPTRLDSMDIMGDVTWSQQKVAEAKRASGSWAVRFDEVGKYEFRLKRWPDELPLAIAETMPEEALKNLAQYQAAEPIKNCNVGLAMLNILGREYSCEVNLADSEAVFNIEIEKKASGFLTATFADEKETFGAYYLYVKRV